jgi:hypothetical protein
LGSYLQGEIFLESKGLEGEGLDQWVEPELLDEAGTPLDQ